MEKLLKLRRITKESTILDMASSVREISESVSSISESYRTLLKVNKALVLYMRNVKNTQSSNIDEIQTDLEEALLGKSS